MVDRLLGRVVIVTGAGRGLGRSVVQGFSAEGATVIAVSRSADELAELAAALISGAGSVEVVPGDLGDDGFIDRLVDGVIVRHGRVDVIVNNAAILEPRLFREMSRADFDRTMQVNLRAPIVLAHTVLPAMLAAGRGSIVNVGSAASWKGFELETHYCAAKFGLEGFSEALAMELRADNIAVNRLTPGLLIKPTSLTLSAAAAVSPEIQATWRDPMPMVDAFTYLALQDGSGTTGHLFDAFTLAEQVRDNGWEARYVPTWDGTTRGAARVG